MPALTTIPPPPGGEREKIPLSALNQYLFCPRRAALIHIEGIFKDNEHTLRGDIVHEHADFAGYESQISNLESPIVWLRALPVWSERLGLNGKCDIVEVHGAPAGANFKSEISNLKSLDTAELRPVEFKLGKRRQWENDDAQLCAQALCHEEMFGVPVERGAVFHAKSKRRREVEFTPELRARTEQAIADLPSKEQLMQQLLGLMLAPHRGIMGVMNGPARQVATVIDAWKKKQEEGAA